MLQDTSRSTASVNSTDDQRHTPGVARAEQETLTTHVSFKHLLQPTRVSVCRCSDTGYFATNTTADEEDPPSSEEENADASAEGNEPELTNNPPRMDTVQPPPLHTPPSQASRQKTSLSNVEGHYREATLQPVVNEDCVAAPVNSEAETDPANLTAREEHDIHGRSKASQHWPGTVAAKQTTAAHQQSPSSRDNPRSEKTIEQQLEVPLDARPEALLEVQAEETTETPREAPCEAQMEDTTETPETPAEALAMPTEESHEVPTKETIDHSKQLLFSDVAFISNLPIPYFTTAGPATVSVAYTQYNVDIDPTDRHER